MVASRVRTRRSNGPTPPQFHPVYPKDLQWTLRDVVRAWLQYGDPGQIDDIEVFKRCLLGTHWYNWTHRRIYGSSENDDCGLTPTSLRRLVQRRIQAEQVRLGRPLSAVAPDNRHCNGWINCLDGISLHDLQLHGL